MEGAFYMVAVGFLQSLWEKPIWEGVWPFLDPMDSVCLRTASTEWNAMEKYVPQGKLSFFLTQKEPAMVSGCWNFSPFFAADTPYFSADLKKCALIALHLIAEEVSDGEDGCHAPGLGGEWKMGCQKSPMWESEGEAWSEDESVSSSGSREGNVGNDALRVIGLCKAWELPHGLGHAVPGNA